jgi:hypothetical protein
MTANENLRGEDLLALQNEKGSICVSVILPTHPLSPERRVDRPEAEKAIEKARTLLLHNYPEPEVRPVMQSLQELLEQVDFDHNANGLGLYVSPAIRKMIRFPFNVEERVVVADRFELREVLYRLYYTSPYYVLIINGKGARLFEGSWDELTEISGADFPVAYEEEFSYNPPSRGTSYSGQAHVKSFERDNAVLEELRLKDFFRKVDAKLKPYIVGETPLVVLAPEEELAWFKSISDLEKRIIAGPPGNYDHVSLKLLAGLVWPVVYAHLQKQTGNLATEFRERIGELRGITGVQDIWQAAREGKGLKLLVEKDYHCPGFVTGDDYRLYLTPPVTPHKTIADAVDQLIETVLEKNGKVVFTENEALKDYGRIALITRY